jgi:RNA polymerase sigma factor (sigma-70 family)
VAHPKPSVRNEILRNELAVANLRLARWYASRLANRLPRRIRARIDENDLFCAAARGLLRAAELWDPSRGVRFSTFALYQMRSQVQRWLRIDLERIHVPQYVRDAVYHSKPHRLSTEFRTYQASRALGAGRQAEDFDGLPQRPGWDGPSQETLEDLDAAIRKLPAQMRTVIEERYLEEKTLWEVGETLGVTKQRVQQLQVQALEKLRELLADTAVDATPNVALTPTAASG